MGGIDPTYQEKGNESLIPLRNNLTQVINQIMSYPESALMSGILLGNQSSLPFSLKNDLKTTSTIHIAVVSGQNLTIMAGFVMSMVSFLGRKKTIALTLGLILFYSVLTGFQIPVIRAAIMAILAYGAQLLGKAREGWWVLFVTGGGMLLYQPNWLLNISFQLSFMATLGVVVVAPILTEAFKIVPRIIRQDLAVTLAAQSLVLPILAYNFGQISLSGVFANLLVLWTIPLIMVGGIISLLLGTVSQLLGQITGLLPAALITYLIYIVRFFAKMPGASMQVGQTSIMLWIGYYLLLFAGIIKLWSNKNYNRT